MYALLGLTDRHQQLALEPSALAGMCGPWRLTMQAEQLAKQGITAQALTDATHLVWATGGGMVPSDEMEKYRAAAAIALKE